MTGVTVVNGVLTIIEEDSYKCKCIKSKQYNEPASAYLMTTRAASTREYVIGELYDYVIDGGAYPRTGVVNPYCVFIYDNNPDSNYFTKEEFDEYFIDIVDNRNNIIDAIIE